MASGFATREQLSASVLQAARRADLEEVQSLVERWRSDELHPGPTAAELRPAMSSAISNGDARMLSYLLDQDSHIHPNLISCAVRGASVAVWQVFLDHGWDINSISGSEPPILKYMVGDERLLRWFLEHGADPNLHGPKNECALDTASNGLHIGAVELLLRHGAKLERSNALHAVAGTRRSADVDCIPMLAYLLDHGAEINALEHKFDPEYFDRIKTHPWRASGTALHRAAFRGKMETVKFLLERGADPKVKNTLGWMASGAVNEYDESGLEELLKHHETLDASSSVKG